MLILGKQNRDERNEERKEKRGGERKVRRKVKRRELKEERGRRGDQVSDRNDNEENGDLFKNLDVSDYYALHNH